MKNTYYFSHDTNANRDERILAMRVDYGWEGYGWYWAIVETMAEATNYKLKFKNGLPNRVAIAGLSLCHNIPIEKLEKFIDDCIKKYGLFNTNEDYFWSETLLKRLSIRDEKTSKLRVAGLKGAEKRWRDDSHPNGEANGHPNGKERKGKEIKLNEKKEREEVRKSISASLKEKPIPEENKKANEIEFDFELLSWHGIDEDIIGDWEKRFPDINVGEQIMKIREYFKNNPEKEKYIKNFAIYINDWLERAVKYKIADDLK